MYVGHSVLRRDLAIAFTRASQQVDAMIVRAELQVVESLADDLAVERGAAVRADLETLNDRRLLFRLLLDVAKELQESPASRCR